MFEFIILLLFIVLRVYFFNTYRPATEGYPSAIDYVCVCVCVCACLNTHANVCIIYYNYVETVSDTPNPFWNLTTRGDGRINDTIPYTLGRKKVSVNRVKSKKNLTYF